MPRVMENLLTHEQPSSYGSSKQSLHVITSSIMLKTHYNHIHLQFSAFHIQHITCDI